MPERKPLEQRFSALKGEATTWIPAWREIRNYVNPTRGRFPGDLPNRGKLIDHKLILDSHPQRMIEKLADGLAAYLTSPSRPWWRPTISDLDLMEWDPVKTWLSDVERVMYAAQAGSNFHGAMHSDYKEYASFATSATGLFEDRRDIMRARNYTIGEYFVGVGFDGRPNAFGYEYEKTAGQLVERYGKENCSPSVQKLAIQNPDAWIKCIYLCVKNPNRKPDQADNRNMEFVAASWEEGSLADTYLEYSGFNEFPYLISRWGVTAQNSYGNGSPGWSILGDSKMLQKLQRDKLLAVEKVNDPPTQQDATVDGKANTLPGGLTRSSALVPNAGVRAAYQINPDIAALQSVITDTKRAVSEGCFENLFMLISQDERAGRTAREIVERSSERLTMLGPLVESLYHEKLSPAVSRQFNIMWRAGQIPPPPPELAGHAINVELISILAQAQKAAGTRAIDETMTFVGEAAKIFPDILDNVDADEAARSRSSMIGVPPRMMRSPESVANLRQARAKQQEASAQQDAIARMAEMAKTASQAKLAGGGSALDAALEG